MKKLVLMGIILQLGFGSFAQKKGNSSYSTFCPDNFKLDNLVAWCIVPFDAMNRSPEERAEMLVDLGLKRVAYDWRQKHVGEFEEEILQYQNNQIEFFAFWDYHETAFELFKKYGLHPQIWKINPSPKTGTREEKIQQAADLMSTYAEKASEIGCKFGLYNHGGWGGEPANLVAVCKAMRAKGYENVGIVYNFHHAHGNIQSFEADMELLKPFLLCLNLNGMVSSECVNIETHDNMILSIGSGKYEADMIKIIIRSGYYGPIGILGHIETQDVAVSLQNNLDGLKKVIEDIK